jgi:CRP/FNR family transcriptional regulator, cyclic AMP receptor protein
MTQSVELGEFSALERIGNFAEVSAQFPEMIRTVPLFRALTDDIRALAKAMQVYVAQEGAVILREGEPGNAMLLIIDGLVQVVRGDPWKGVTLGILDHGKTLGEMSIVDQKPRSATCVALQHCVFAVLSQQSLERLIEERPRLGATILREVALMLSARLRRTNEKVDDDFSQFVEV